VHVDPPVHRVAAQPLAAAERSDRAARLDHLPRERARDADQPPAGRTCDRRERRTKRVVNHAVWHRARVVGERSAGTPPSTACLITFSGTPTSRHLRRASSSKIQSIRLASGRRRGLLRGNPGVLRAEQGHPACRACGPCVP
jgi:hypothetical protein